MASVGPVSGLILHRCALIDRGAAPRARASARLLQGPPGTAPELALNFEEGRSFCGSGRPEKRMPRVAPRARRDGFGGRSAHDNAMLRAALVRQRCHRPGRPWAALSLQSAPLRQENSRERHSWRTNRNHRHGGRMGHKRRRKCGAARYGEVPGAASDGSRQLPAASAARSGDITPTTIERWDTRRWKQTRVRRRRVRARRPPSRCAPPRPTVKSESTPKSESTRAPLSVGSK
jgi:hypothetical protein